MTDEHKATLTAAGCTDDHCTQLAAIASNKPTLNFGNLVAFVTKYAQQNPNFIQDVIALFKS